MDRFVVSCQEGAKFGMEQLLKTLSYVPDERLHWAPSPTAKSALQIAAHAAVYAANFAQMMRDRALPDGEELNAFLARTAAAEMNLTSRSDVERTYRGNTEVAIGALGTLDSEAIEMRLEASNGISVSMKFLMQLPEIHGFSHAAQIDYLQTCWGDEVVHF